MKTIITGISAVLAYAGISACSIWAIVEFILYLAKDHPFNWWSVWMILICIGSSITLMILTVFFADLDKADKIDFTPRKSAFQKRLEQLEEQRNRLNK